jgi:hypothetical protein
MRQVPLIAGAVAFALVVTPQWASALLHQARVHGDASELAATAWAIHHIPKRDVVVVDDYMWTDLRLRGMNPLWFWKIDADPQVSRTILRHGYQSIDYIILEPLPPNWIAEIPTLRQALDHSTTIRRFPGGITVRMVLQSRTHLAHIERMASRYHPRPAPLH